jgi:hypothetical protein
VQLISKLSVLYKEGSFQSTRGKHGEEPIAGSYETGGCQRQVFFLVISPSEAAAQHDASWSDKQMCRLRYSQFSWGSLH